MKTPLFSIIIPIYNAEKYLQQTLSSVLSQNIHNIEVICLDDGSSDNSLRLLEDFAAEDTRIRIAPHSTNQGPGKLRNQGIELATGAYILFLDSDDWYEKGLFEQLAQIIQEQPNINIIEFRFNLSQNGGVKKKADWLSRGSSGIREVGSENLLLATGAWNKCWRKEFLQKNKLRFCETNRSGEEIPLHICGFLVAQEFYYLDFVGYNWRWHQESLSHDPKKDESFLAGVWDMLSILETELKRLNLYSSKEYIHYCETILHWHIKEKVSWQKPFRRYYKRCQQFEKTHNISPVLPPFWYFALKQLKKKVKTRIKKLLKIKHIAKKNKKTYHQRQQREV